MGTVEVRYGLADKSHENEFFRFFARSVKAYFEQKGINACLVGMPECKVFEKLQLDALLITDRTITIVDFKNYSGSLTLPEEDDFRRGLWKTDDGVTVKGGSSPNPFCQLGLQRERLAKVLSTFCKNLSGFNPYHVATMVCFSRSMSVRGQIPGKFQAYFHIADETSFLEKLFDIVSAGREDAGLLDPRFLDYLNSKVFLSEEYDLSVTPESLGVSREEARLPEPEPKPTELDAGFKRFFEGDSSVLLVAGTVGSGKVRTVSSLRDAALASGFASARVFALSNRVKRNLLGALDEVESLYATLYDLPSAKTDEAGRQFVPIAKRDTEVAFGDIEDDARRESAGAFIVYESQLVTDSYRADEFLQFGSGRLLTDLLSFLGIGTEGSRNKVVFVGDKFQLGFGSWSDSSLNPAWYSGKANVSEIELPDTDCPNGIQRVCLSLANSIRLGRTCNFVIEPNDQVAVAPASEEASLLKDAYASSGRHKVLSYTNGQASGLNKYIKRNIACNGPKCQVGDYVLFENQVTAFPARSSAGLIGSVPAFEDREPRRVQNGEFAEIVGLGGPEEQLTLRERVSPEEPPVELTLVRADVSLASSFTRDAVEVYFIKEVLESDEAGLSPMQETALHIHLSRLLEELASAHPFEKSQHFSDMMASGDYQVNAAGRYRDKEDARFLTKYERRHRAELQATISGPGSEYWKWTNAARVKYGWCMTVHKAMSYEFGEITLSAKVDGGRRNESYFKLLYTGISRAREKANVVRWLPVSPFEKTEFGATGQGAPRQKKHLITTTAEKASSDILEFVGSLPEHSFGIRPLKTAQYQEQFEISAGGSSCKIVFDYGKDGKVRPPRYLTGDGSLFEELTSLIASRSDGSPSEPRSDIQWLYDYLAASVLEGYSIGLVSSSPYEDALEIEHGGKCSLVRVVHNKKQEISSFKLMSGDEGTYRDATAKIITHYQLEADMASR